MTTNDDTITLFHAPQTRSSGTLTLLEELGAPYKRKRAAVTVLRLLGSP